MDAFLRENGTGTGAWAPDLWREVVEQLRAITAASPDTNFGPLIEELEKQDPPSDWDPDQAK
ncbi:hypothetical protein [Crystallibacter degradans]|uniref:hypothetical protein n=1 Tax=Crystallibacter degradans TaxID=2726743 RepID=UPI001473CC18|nr:hypothetical protein [Arthrobacter sp. SF27]NMR32335.1 hypothetical protein [Arthrobacter sp. SF27]